MMTIETRMETQTNLLEYPLIPKKQEEKIRIPPTRKPSGDTKSGPTRKPSGTNRSVPTRKWGRWQHFTSPLSKWLCQRRWVWWRGRGYRHFNTTAPKGHPTWGYVIKGEECTQYPPTEENWIRKLKDWPINAIHTGWEWPKQGYIVVISAWSNGTLQVENWIWNINWIS